QEIKRHVLQNLLDTEQSYVQNLQYLVTNYLKPLKRPENANIVEPAQVDEMFYQIPDILLCHEFFLDQLQARVNDWHDKQKIGDIIVASFTKCFLMDAYSAFINHFLHARAAVRVATMSRPGFARFIEQCCRDHREKLTLQDLMIMPVQRIPRYVLILKDMIKHTPTDHPDHGSLQLAMGEIKTLANRMNMREKEVNKAEKDAEDLRAIEASIEGISDLVIPGRYFKRKDLAAEVRGSITKKDRSLFLFNDLLVCAIVKRKPNALRRGSLSLFSGQSGAGAEFNKHKLLWKLPLEYIELLRSSPEVQRRNSLERELERLDNDMSLLSQISALSDTLNISHQITCAFAQNYNVRSCRTGLDNKWCFRGSFQMLDSSIRELMNDVSRQIAERQVPVQQSLSAKLELQAQTEEGPETFTFLLLDAEIKNSWESDFMNARKELALSNDWASCLLVGFQLVFSRLCLFIEISSSVAVTGWRSSTIRSIASILSSHRVRHTLIKAPIASLSVCSSRILCISPVPGARLIGLETIHPDADSKSDTRSLGESSSYKVPSTKSTDYEDEDDDEDGLGNDSFMEGKFGSGSPMFDGRLSPEGSSLGTIDGEMESSDDDESVSDENASSDDDDKRKHGRKHIGKSRNLDSGTVPVPGAEDKLSDIVPFEAEEGSTVWLGTEDGSIYVYPVQDIQQKKKMRIQHNAAVHCILYVDNQVFVALGNGDLCVYRRQPGCPWEVSSPIIVPVGSGAPVTCMTAVHGRLWCGCQCNAIIVNTTTLKIEVRIVNRFKDLRSRAPLICSRILPNYITFNCSLDKERAVYRLVSSGMGVWLSLQSSATVRLFHATKYECLADVDVGPPVHKMLAGSDAIIRQHKAACLRVTSLLTCRDLLWIGTSAGVVLTLPLPTITVTTSSLRNSPSASASYHGHTGHVRFLTAVEVPKPGDQDTTLDKERNNSVTSSSTPDPPLTPGEPGVVNGPSRHILIISGGDGYEDFKTSSTSESAGRDDSTNHLLVWQV
ncbi:predicted protein, partial [Nematostella vectensis]